MASEWPEFTVSARFHSAPVPPPRDFQRVRNESWPRRDVNGNVHARGIRERAGIDVRVRIVWERDGEQWVEGRAVRWHRQHVCVHVSDERLQVPYVWVVADDVRRR